MSSWDVFDLQPTAGRILQSAAEKNRLVHAYLFYGLPGTGKWAAALNVAQQIMCADARSTDHRQCQTCRRIAEYNHPDVHWLPPLAARDNVKTAMVSDGEPGSATNAQAAELQEIFELKKSDPWVPVDYPRQPYITIQRVRALQHELSRTATEGRSYRRPQ